MLLFITKLDLNARKTFDFLKTFTTTKHFYEFHQKSIDQCPLVVNLSNMNFSKIFICFLVFTSLHICDAEPRCYRLDMNPTAIQFCEKMNNNYLKIKSSILSTYRFEQIKTYRNKNKVDPFEIEVAREIRDTISTYFNYNDRSWYDCYSLIFWLFQACKYEVLFTEYNKKEIEAHLEPFKKDLLRFHPKSISDKEIENAIQGMFFVNRTSTPSVETPKPSLWERMFPCFF